MSESWDEPVAVAEIPEVKLFGKWSSDDVQVSDISLTTFTMGKRRVLSDRKKSLSRKVKMRERRAQKEKDCQQVSCEAKQTKLHPVNESLGLGEPTPSRGESPKGLRDPLHSVDKSLGLGEPSPLQGESPNAGRLVTPLGSLSIPGANRDVPPRSDSLTSRVCTPPSVPLSNIDSAGQTNPTDSHTSVCTPEQRVTLPPCNAVGYEYSEKVAGNKNEPNNEIKNQTNTAENKKFISKDHATDKSSYMNRKQKASKGTLENNAEDEDIIFIQHIEPEHYTFCPLLDTTRSEIISHLETNFAQSATEDAESKDVLGKPTKTHAAAGDGNCFFRALSYSISGTEENHKTLREKVVSHMLDNDPLFSAHLRSGYGSVHNYMRKKRMYHNGVWATEVEILAAADMLSTDIFVYEESNLTWLKFSARQVRGFVDVCDKSIYLIHRYQAHYDVVLDVEVEEETVETFAGNKQSTYFVISSASSAHSDNDGEDIASDFQPVIQGHFDQSDARFGENAGKQCVMNSISALMYSQQKPTSSWTSNDVDHILTNGNDMYQFVQSSGTVHHDFLAIADIPTSMEYDGILYKLVFSEPQMGRLGGEPLKEFMHVSLEEALNKAFVRSCSNAAVVTFKQSTFIIIKQDNQFCIADSHSRSTDGSVCPNGKSTVIHYKSLRDVFRHTLRLAESMIYRDEDDFEVTAVEINRNITAEQSLKQDTVQNKRTNPFCPSENVNFCLQQYFKDQQQRQATKRQNLKIEANTIDKSKYMRLYMSKRRQKSDLSSKQKMKQADKQRKKKDRQREPEKYKKIDVASKRKSRSQISVLEMEKMSKMVAREKDLMKYKKIDRISKQKSRTNPKVLEARKKSMMNARRKDPMKYKEIDRISKQKARTNPEVLDVKKKSMANARRKDPMKYKKIDRISKQKARTNPEVLDVNKKSMMNARRKNPIKYKKIDLISKQKARTNPEVLELEKKSKMNARMKNPIKYRKIDCISKQKSRTNLEVLEVEKKSKANSRRKNPLKYKNIDLTSKQTARQNVLVLEKEKTRKRKLRLDPYSLKAEAEKDIARKKKLRLCELFLEKERMKQSERRKTKKAMRKHANGESKTSKQEVDIQSKNDQEQYIQRRFGQNLEECIKKFHCKVERGPEYVCTSCHQTWFKESVVDSAGNKVSNFKGHLTGYKSVHGKEWICHTCLTTLKKGQTPKLSVANGMKLPNKPPELNLHPLEERLIALRMPFMQIRELPRGGQYSEKGNVVNVPVDLQPTVNALPRQMDEHFAIAVKLKKRLSHKSNVCSENVRPQKVLVALHWLMNNSDLYKTSGVKIDDDWVTETTNAAEEIVTEFLRTPDTVDTVYTENQEHSSAEEATIKSSNKRHETETDLADSFEEITEDDCIKGNSDTLIDEAYLDSNKTIVVAPGENQKPLSLYQDKYAEELSFPTIYCGQKRLENDQRCVPVPYSDLAKWELRNVDRRAAICVPNIFFKLNKIQRKQVADKVNLAVRRKKTEGKKITAEEARNPETAHKIVSLNDGYYIFKTLRNSPAYLSSRKKDVFAMIRQLGLPTWFMSLSCADTRWTELLKTLALLSGKPCSNDDLHNMTWNDKTKLVQKDPVTACRYFDHRVQVFINTVLKSEYSPVGTVTDYFQRVEFQNRGSPHVHMMIWTQNAPKYQEASNTEIVNFVERYVSCSKDTDENMQDLVQIQTHKHSKTCKKGGKAVCRFGFPLPPLNETMVLEPLEADIDKYRKQYSDLHKRMNEFKDECIMTYEEFLVNVVQMDEEDYIKCIRSSLKGPKVFLKREPSEMRINYYNDTVLKAWKANIDLQFVLDPYACAMYIVSYISKSQRGMSTMLEQASKEATEGNMDLKRQVRHIGNKFLNFVEISAQEAAYLVLQMPLTRSSRHVVFINTSPPEERVFLLKNKEELDTLPGTSTNIESDNIMKRYAKRPKQLETYCLADYVSELEVIVKNKKENPHAECNEDDNVEPCQDSDSDSETEFTEETIVMKLKNGITIRKRKSSKVIRYVRYSKDTNSENYYREKLLLFMPWRCEDKDLKGQYDSFKDHFQNIQEQVAPLIKKYENFIDELDLAREQAEADTSEFDTLAPATEQTEAEDADAEINSSEEFIHFQPSTASERIVDIGHDLGLAATSVSTEIRSELLPDHEYRSLVGSLNKSQREFFTHVVRWITTQNEPLYAFLTGGAGVGKSVVIRALYQALHRQLNSQEGDDPDSIKVLLTAFTGKAAYNISGSTIASAFHKKMFQKNQHMHSDELNTFRTTYKDLKVIIIDEISMVGNKLFEFIHERLQELTGTKRDFGGISIIAVGDLYQLSPVADSWIFSDLTVGLAKNLWKEHFKMFELTEIMRQKDDLKFAELLNRLRFNKLLQEDREIIKSHLTSKTVPTYPQKALHLFTENKKVDAYNNDLIQKKQTTKVEVKADTDVIAPATISKESKSNLIREINKKEKHTQTANLPSVCKLAVGMIYDVTVNIDVKDGLTNGSSSVLQHIEFKQSSTVRPAIVWVLFDDPNIGEKRRNQYRHLYHSDIDKKWTPIFETKRTFLYNKKTYERIQFPLVPAAAKTIHKAQGTTVDELVVDLSSSYKAPHIHYVALSRVRKLANLHILDFNEKALTVDDKVHKEIERLSKDPLQLCYTPVYRNDNSHLKIVFHNARSLHRHIDDVKNDPNIQSADIIGIAESRLCNIDNSQRYQITGFNMHRVDDESSTQTRPSHGLVIYVKNKIALNKLKTHKYDGIEFGLIEVTHELADVQMIFLYKTPNVSVKQLKDCLQKIRPSIFVHKPLFFLGDFNIDISKDQTLLAQFMNDMFSCTQLLTSPTTVHNTLIDHVYANVHAKADAIPTYWSDHYLIYACWSK